jgi:superfamily II DNA or RNA helicase
MIKFEQFNETHMRVFCDDFGTEQEMQEFFTFMAPGYKFMPAFKNKIWDGKIKLLDARKKTLYKGLLSFAINFCKSRDYEFEVDPKLNPSTGIKEEQVQQFIDSLQLTARGKPLEVRDYQYQAVHKSLESKRNLLLSPTSSGKSLILYSKIRWHLDKLDHRVLVVVPTTMLVEQLFNDFKDYSTANGWNVEENIQLLYSGKEKLFYSNVMISTWQSLTAMMKNQPAAFRDLVKQVDVALFDEAHTYKASAVLQTMEKFTDTEWRTGTTGTIDNNKINELSLIGLMGPIYKVITTKALMDAGQVTSLKIKALLLQYPEYIRKAMKGMTYQQEVDFIVSNETRNRFIANLTKACKGNTLVLFNYVERHGSVLYELVQQRLSNSGRTVHFIHGGTDVDDREAIRHTVEHEKDSVIIATASLFSTGINIPSIQNIIFAVPSKSTIRIRQSIGRGLRLKEGKTHCNLFDIVDDLSYKSWQNTTLKHFQERVSVYDSEQFDWEVRKVELEKVPST